MAALRNVVSQIFTSRPLYKTYKPSCIKKCMSSLNDQDIRIKRNELFNRELERQKGLITRIEKIEVILEDPSHGCTLHMNKSISTPFHCAMHVNKVLEKRSVLALVNGKPWDMHRPLVENCKLELLHFRIPEPQIVNKTYWRSCSFLLGLILKNAFKENIFVELHSWPAPDVESGSFVYDVNMRMDNWNPRQDELQTLTTLFLKLSQQNEKFERLRVDDVVAKKLFQDNRFKLSQIPEIAKMSEDQKSVTLYRVGDHIDISYGPMISHTGLVGRSSITSVHRVDINGETLLRFQGVSLPHQLPMSYFAYQIVKDRARNLNRQGLTA